MSPAAGNPIKGLAAVIALYKLTYKLINLHTFYQPTTRTTTTTSIWSTNGRQFHVLASFLFLLWNQVAVRLAIVATFLRTNHKSFKNYSAES